MRSVIVAALLLATGPAFAGVPAVHYYDPVVAFGARVPACADRPSARWIGHVSGFGSADRLHVHQSVSFVGCFDTEAACARWRDRGAVLASHTIRLAECAPRVGMDDD